MSTARSPIRHKYGVVPITLYTKPSDCGGNCIFCPSAEGLPKSYLANADTLLAASNNFSPRVQLQACLGSIKLSNSFSEQDLPLEIIILGGSFSALSKHYRREFLSEVYRLLSEYKIQHRGGALITARCSVLTVESRPDQISESECEFLGELGVSKVEIGVQHTCDDILKSSGRGHTQNEVISATKLLKDYGFKVGYHVMLGLPGATKEQDSEMLGSKVWSVDYNPDYLKIYPCELLSDRNLQPVLHTLHETGRWSAPNEQYCLDVINSSASKFPEHVRLSRIQRQFSRSDVLEGPGARLRQKLSATIFDIRSREAGISLKEEDVDLLNETRQLFCRSYGNRNDHYFEVCLGSKNVLLAIARLRVVPGQTPILREIKVFGRAAPVGKTGQVQGKGLGTRLLTVLESFVFSAGHRSLLVNAAFGARSFFQRHGYTLNDRHLMEKSIPELGTHQYREETI